MPAPSNRFFRSVFSFRDVIICFSPWRQDSVVIKMQKRGFSLANGGGRSPNLGGDRTSEAKVMLENYWRTPGSLFASDRINLNRVSRQRSGDGDFFTCQYIQVVPASELVLFVAVDDYPEPSVANTGLCALGRTLSGSHVVFWSAMVVGNYAIEDDCIRGVDSAVRLVVD